MEEISAKEWKWASLLDRYLLDCHNVKPPILLDSATSSFDIESIKESSIFSEDDNSDPIRSADNSIVDLEDDEPPAKKKKKSTTLSTYESEALQLIREQNKIAKNQLEVLTNTNASLVEIMKDVVSALTKTHSKEDAQTK